MSSTSNLNINNYGINSLLGDLVDFEYGKGLRVKERNENGSIPVMGSNGIIGYHDRSLIKGPAIIVGRKGAVGEITYISEDSWPIDTTYYVKVPNSLNIKFFFFLLKSLILSRLDKSTAIPGLNRNDAYAIPVFLPPLPEQRAIVAKIEQLFSELDSGVANLKKTQEQLKVYRQAVLKWAFEGKFTAAWRKQQDDLPTAETLLSRIKTEREEQAKKSGKKLKPLDPVSEEELAKFSKLPEGWGWVKIGYFTLGVEYGTSAKSKKNGKVPVLRMGNIQSGKFNWDDLVFTDDQEEINKYLLKKNDVLFNRTNSPELVGKTAIYKGERQAIFAGYLIRVNQIPTIVNSDYLNYFLNCHYAKKHGFSVKTDGVNQSNINGEKLFNYPISICTLSEQEQIVGEIEERLSVCDKLEETISQSLLKAESLRQSILKKAFEGKLLNETELAEAQNAPDWEPAEKLLERIKKEKETQNTIEKKNRQNKKRKDK
jgi:type I restriction enzyme S subunit